ncbi:unnamed protein product [Echinostoma caproni]|uniref:Hexosyltransferase n=1 Tax=Echinostoma caproni TaxID=27848 RepID=A0A183AEK7_9TREM|nr:unnamed protein product [Echinostoma caproni]
MFYVRLRWLARTLCVLFIVIFITLTILYINNGYALDSTLYSYPLDVNLYKIYSDLGPDGEWTPSLHLPVRPINLANFSLIRAPQSLCIPEYPELANESIFNPVDIIFIVKTRLSSFSQRNAIRQTWANASCAANLNYTIRTVFALGSPAFAQPWLDNRLQQEHDEYHDLLQFSFVDAYHNNTYKMMTSLKYVSKHCRNARFVVIMDEDFLVHIKNMIRILDEVPQVQHATYVAGYVFSTPIPERRPWKKWYVSYALYPHRFYPPYPTGGTVIMSMPVVRLVAAGMPFVKFFWIDDTYLGIVLQKYGISPQNIRNVYLSHAPVDSELSTLVSAHQFGTPWKMRQGWNKLLRLGVCQS